MKLKSFLSFFLMTGLLSLSSTANAQFDFGGPFDFFDNDDDYNSYRSGGRQGYGRERWRRYDEWEPNYWRYRFFDDDSDDYIFDEFDGGDFFDDGNFFGNGRGRGRFNFDMDMDSDFDGNYDGDYNSDFRRDDRYGRRDNRYGNDDRQSRRADQYRGSSRYGDDDRQSRRADQNRSGSRSNDDNYDDDYWRNYSRRYDGSSRSRMSRTPDYERRRAEQESRKPVECR